MTYSRKKIDIDKEWLKTQYTSLGRSKSDIASDLGCSKNTVDKWLRVWQIRRGEKKCYKAWNKGITKDTDPRMKKLSEDRRGSGNPMFGKKPWNGGLTALTDERLARISEGRKGVTPNDETKLKMRLAKIGKRGSETNHWKGGKAWVGKNGYLSNYRGYLHRQLIEDALGRKLKTSEHVHHLDVDVYNNSIDNLIVLSNSAHSKLHSWMGGKKRLSSTQKLWLIANNFDYETANENI